MSPAGDGDIVGRRDAAVALGELLADPGFPYRGRWALLGTTPRRGICDAFGMTARHRAQLVALWESSPGGLALAHPDVLGEQSRRGNVQPDVARPARDYHSVWVLEDHHIGADRRPREHRTTQTLAADVDELRHITLRIDADCVAVDVEQGGRASGGITRITEGLWGQRIVLDRPAARGEHRNLVYTTYFRYAEDPPPEFRRSGGSDPHAHIEIRVQFHPDCLPTEICHCVWPTLDRPPLTEAVLQLDEAHSAAMVFNILQPGGLVGFRWTWPDQS